MIVQTSLCSNQLELPRFSLLATITAFSSIFAQATFKYQSRKNGEVDL